MARLKAAAQFTITASDILVSGTAPSAPVTDQLWCDTSSSPPQLKRWAGSAWVVVTDFALTGRVTTVEAKVTDTAIINTVTGSPTYRGDKVYVQTTTPASPTSGMKWLDISADPNMLKVYNGTSWDIVGDFQGQLNHLSSSVTQTAELITQYVSKNDQSRYITFDATNGVLIGDTSSSFKVQILSNRINILQNTVPIAYFASNKLFIEEGELRQLLTIGNYTLKKTTDGGIAIG